MRPRLALIRGWSITTAAAIAAPATAQDATTSDNAPAAAANTIAAQTATAAAAAPSWIAGLSAGVLARDGGAAQPFGVAALSRRLGRGYVRIAATRFDSVLKQVDATLPSTFYLASIGAGGTFGQWFVDASASGGRQHYGGVTTMLGTRPSSIGSGSGVYGGSLSGGRFVRLSPRLYVTPSLSVQYSAQRVLRSSLGAMGPQDYETDERAWTGGITVRLDRFFGRDSRHLAGLSISRVQTSNGVVALLGGAAGNGGTAQTTLASVGDGWFVAGASTSLRLATRIWLDASGSRTTGARSGDYSTGSLGVRIGF